MAVCFAGKKVDNYGAIITQFKQTFFKTVQLSSVKGMKMSYEHVHRILHISFNIEAQFETMLSSHWNQSIAVTFLCEIKSVRAGGSSSILLSQLTKNELNIADDLH